MQAIVCPPFFVYNERVHWKTYHTCACLSWRPGQGAHLCLRQVQAVQAESTEFFFANSPCTPWPSPPGQAVFSMEKRSYCSAVIISLEELCQNVWSL